jgi:sec-independent protein translocase protein TatB
MFDISWTEFVLIGVVALIVIGPKELPGVLRTLGQYTRKIRSMAADFQNQFQEAMREAEIADLKEQVDDVARGVKSYDPFKDVRTDVEAAGRDIRSSLETPTPTPAPTTPAAPQQETPAVTGPVAPEAAEPNASAPESSTAEPEPVAPEPAPYAREAAIVAAAIAPVAPEPAQPAAKPDAATRQGG